MTITAGALTDADVLRFVRDGAIVLKEAFPRAIADDCRHLLWEATGCDEHDPSTWTRPVVRVAGRADPQLATAINTARLRSAFDQHAGIRRWVPRNGVGTFPRRFPIDEDPGDDGWHIEAAGKNAHDKPVVDADSKE